MQDTIFTKIIKRELPAHIIYEDDKTLAFLDIHPVQPGMVLVVSKLQVIEFVDLPDEDYVALWQTVKKVAKKLKQVFPEKQRIAIQVEGLDVPHVHVKLFPIDSGEEFHQRPQADAAPPSELSSVAQKLTISSR